MKNIALLLKVFLVLTTIGFLASCEEKENIEDNPVELEEETPPCYTTDMKSTNSPTIESREYTIDEQIKSADFVTVLKIESYIGTVPEYEYKENSTFKVKTLKDLKGITTDNFILESRARCGFNPTFDDFLYTGNYGYDVHNLDFFREGNYYLVVSFKRNDNQGVALHFRELPKYKEYLLLEEQSEIILEIVNPYIEYLNND
jgi:hypothetical protein